MKGILHFLRDCKSCPDYEKKEFMQKLVDPKDSSGPAANIRSQSQKTESASTPTVSKSVGRESKLNPNDPSTFEVNLTEGDDAYVAKGHAEESTDESIISLRVVEYAVVNGIERMTNLHPVPMQVSLKYGSDAEKFTLSRTWTAPLTILKLSAGPLEHLNEYYIVTDANIFSDNILHGLLVLCHLGVDTKTLLEESRDLLDVSDCSYVNADRKGKGGSVSLLMLSRINCVTKEVVIDKKVTSTTSDVVLTHPRLTTIG